MVNLPTIAPITTELASVNHLTNNGQANSRKRMANCGFMRSDRWSLKYGYSYNTVNKYRDELYGDEAFLPPTPSTGGRIRIANEVADKLRQHGVRPRHSETKRRPNCPPKRVNRSAADPSTGEVAKAVYALVKDAASMTQLVTVAVGIHGIGGVLEMLVEAEAESSQCRDLPCPTEGQAAA